MSITRFFCFRLCILFHRFFPVALLFSSIIIIIIILLALLVTTGQHSSRFFLSRLLAEVGDFRKGINQWRGKTV